MPRYYEGKYVGPDQRREMESKDSGILPTDRGIANMPQSAMYVPWAGSPELTPINAPEGLNDTREGIDQQIMEDLGQKKPIGTVPSVDAPPAEPAPAGTPAAPAASASAPSPTEAATQAAAADVDKKPENPNPF